jgi:L-lactate dehydrogenase complex protein LldG
MSYVYESTSASGSTRIETASTSLWGRRAGSRTASLLPPVHLALVRRDAIVATPGDLLRHLPERLPDGLPSNLVLITGPSRSADIELQLTVGVHGPRELVIGLL